MKRKITFLLAALLLMSGLTWAQQITWSAADQGYENAQVIESVDFDDFVTGAFFKGTNNNAPKYYNTGAAIRCYGGNYFTITSDYILTEIVLGFASGEGTNAITTSVGSYENGTWTGSANEVTFTINGTSGHRRIASFTITYDEGGTPTPSITASNVSLTYDATEGFITYAINNEPSPAGELSADVTEGTWLNVGTINDTTVQVTCSANEAASSREGVITLTYNYGDSETVTKDVTVTQEGAPVAYTTIPELFAAATSTGTDVLVNSNNWVVSGVSTNGKNVFVTDNESNGLVIFDNNGGLGDIYTVGDILSGETSCTLKLYNGFAELLNVNAEDLTITEGGSITEATVAMADLTGVNTGALLHYENLTCSVNNNKYYLTDGTTTLQVYNALYAFEALENGKVYNITGIYQQYNSTKEILPRSADDIEEVVPTDPFIDAENVALTYDATEGAIAYTINNPVDGGSIAASVESEWLYVDEEAQYTAEGSFTLLCDPNTGDARTATVTLTYSYGEANVTKDVTVTQAAAPVSSITVAPATVNAPFTGKQGTLTVTYENITEVVAEVYFCNAEGDAAEYDWIVAEINAENNVEYLIEENEGEARTAYLKVYALDDNAEYVYSNLVTINQYEYVAPTYATLPFEFNGGKADIENTDGLYQQGLGSDYGSAPKLKFDGTGDYLLLQFLEEPDTLAFDIKGNSFSGGTFTVQVSADGETYTDWAIYTELGAVQHDKYAINSDVRYIKWVYTEKVTGNVALGNITLSKLDIPTPPTPSVAVEPYVTNLESYDAAEGQLAIIANNIEVNDAQINYYELVENEFVLVEEAPAWLALQVNQVDYSVINYYVEANTSDARTAYFKLGLQSYPDLEYYYSDIVTISQPAYVAPEPPAIGWVLTDLADLTADDVFVFVGNNEYGAYAMLNDYGTQYAPGAGEVTVSDDGTHLTGDIDESMQWNISGNANDGYVFYPNGDTESWLYCTNTNNGVRVGTNDANVFSLDEATGYLKHNATGRYIGIYNSQDWRCYTNTTGNIAGQTFAFYKKVGDEPLPVASITVSPDEVTLDAGEHLINYLDLAYENIEVENTQSFTVHYYNAEGEEIQPVQGETWMVAGVVKPEDVYQVLFTVIANEGEARTAYFKVSCGETYSNLVTINQEAYVAPAVATVTVEPALIEATTAETEGTLTVTYENITNIYAAVYFYDADGNETTYDWITADMDEDNNVYYLIDANEGEARTAYLQVWAFDDNYEYVASNMVTINQAAGTTPVVEGWVLTNLADLTTDDVFVIVGTDFYGDLFAMSNDNGTATAPAAVSVTVVDDMLSAEPDANIQWNLSIAENGYIFLPNGDTESWLYCNTTSGNGNNNNMRVGDGSRNVFTFDNDGYMITNDGYATRYMSVYNDTDWRGYLNTNNNPVVISFYKKVSGPQPVVASITVNPDMVNVDANEHEGTLALNYANLTITSMEDFDIQYYDAEGAELEGEPEWIEVLVAEQDPAVGEGYVVSYFMLENEDEARTAYFKVFAINGEEFVYSNLVTISQEAPVAPVTGGWVLTDLADLTEGDVFVIVGTTALTETFALPNTITGNNAPEVVAIEVDDENNKLTEEPADNIQWNISRQGDSYTFYPNGDAENWLYFKSSNNGVRVGNDNNNTFYMDNDDYLVNEGTSRYLSIYYNTNLHQAQDWRCYNNTNSAVAISFYKKVVENETYTLAINGYGDSEGGYRLIASPVYVNPANVEGMTEGNFDLYQFDQSQEDEWRNYEAENGQFNLVPGKGYLYAHDTDVELTFTGTPYSGDGTITLTKDDNATFAGWNLVGNPFTNWAYFDRDYYTMNEAGTEIIAGNIYAIAPMEGIFVIAAEDGETMTFVENEWGPAYPVKGINLNVSHNTNAVIDRTIVRFNEGRQLPKFQLNAESTKLYIPQGNEDFAVVRSAAYGEMPVNFKAQSNGTYTISVNAENVEASYLHLIDNMTGNDIDLLQVPFYSFKATTSDYVSRFRLVFNITGVEENTTGTEPFAFFNGSEWVVSNIGNATLQMVDLTGRILSSESISGNATVSTSNLSTGIYMLRLVNGENVKTQKMVVK